MFRKGWIVTAAGIGLNLALGILYAWSIFAKQLAEPPERGGFGWTGIQATLPYTLAIACFAVMMVPGGKLQDRLGPRRVATAGAVLTGIGLIVASFASPTTTLPAVIGFGLLAGTGIGLGYAAATPAAVKWFPPEKKGLVTGLVVGGFGLAPVYIAPLAKHLLAAHGVGGSFRILGVAFLAVTVVLAQLVTDPAAGPGSTRHAPAGAPAAEAGSWRAMVRAPGFWSLYLQYAFAATAGLMVIGHLARIVTLQSGGALRSGFLFVALLAAFNAAGRVLAGVVSDRIGRRITIASVCALQALNMLFFAAYSTAPGFLLGSALVGFSYGACLSLFPATTADQWGTRNLGLHYGILFTAWGLGGVFGPVLAGRIADATGSYELAYQIAAALLLGASFLATLGHVGFSATVAEGEVTIRIGTRRAPSARPPPAEATGQAA